MRPQISDRRIAVYPINAGELAEQEFDFGVYSIGYEDGSAFVGKLLAPRCRKLISLDLGGPAIHSYADNRVLAEKLKTSKVEASRLSLREPSVIPPHKSVGDERIFLDVSSMDRRSLGIVLYHLLTTPPAGRIQLYILYAPAVFTAPTRHIRPVKFSGPVNDLLGGGPKDPRMPTVMFLGLGYEVGLALSMVETFEPASVFAYVPRGTDKRFDRHVDRINLPLFADGRYVSRVEYPITAPTNALIDLKERLLAVKDQARVIMVPSGPKMFSAMGILFGYVYSPEVCVWRVSSELVPATAQRHAQGTITGFRVEIESGISATN